MFCDICSWLSFALWHFVSVQFFSLTFCRCDILFQWHFVYVIFWLSCVLFISYFVWVMLCPVLFSSSSIFSCDMLSRWRFFCVALIVQNRECKNSYRHHFVSFLDEVMVNSTLLPRWLHNDDMIVEYPWNAENVKDIRHVTSSWRH